MVSLVLFMSFARVLCNRYDARWISKTKSQNTRKWRTGGIINPLFDGLTYDTSGHFAHCSYQKNTTQLAKYLRVLYVKPLNKVYIFMSLMRIQLF